MDKNQVGIVMEVSGKVAKVKVGRHSECSNCGACPGSDALIIDADNSIGAKVGNRVEFEAEKENMLMAVFVVCVIPILGILIGAGVGYLLSKEILANSSILEAIGGIIVFILAIVFILHYEKMAKAKNKNLPKIVKLL